MYGINKWVYVSDSDGNGNDDISFFNCLSVYLRPVGGISFEWSLTLSLHLPLHKLNINVLLQNMNEVLCDIVDYYYERSLFQTVVRLSVCCSGWENNRKLLND